jgi:ribosomal-protein-alanine N-acetyltransferase
MHAERYFDWRQIGMKQRAVLREIAGLILEVRSVSPADIERLLDIQSNSREVSQWSASDFLSYDSHVAVVNGTVAGFLVSRSVADGEREVLNVAVHPDMRHSGAASLLIRSEIERWPGTHFLEVRESNWPARQLYRKLGFEEVGTRPGYYDNPTETAIVMRIHS